MHWKRLYETATRPTGAQIHGPGADRVIDVRGPYADQEQLRQFLALYDEKHAIDKCQGVRNWRLVQTIGLFQFQLSKAANGRSTPMQARRSQ